MRWNLIVPPKVEPVSLKEAKTYLRVDHNLDDVVIETMITALRQRIETYVGRSLITQQLCVHGVFPIALVHPPVQEVLEVSVAGRALTKDQYRLDASQEYVALSANRPRASSFQEGTVTYRAGYGDTPEHVPHALKLALLYWVHRYYDTRAHGSGLSSTDICEGVHFLLAPFCTARI